MTIKRKSALAAFLSLMVVVVVIGFVAWRISSRVVLNTLLALQIDNNLQQAERISHLIEQELISGKKPEDVQADFQKTLSLLHQDDSGFVCMLGSQAEILCHPDEKMIGRKIGGAVREGLNGESITFDEAISKKIPGGGIFKPNENETQIVWQKPVKGQNWMMSVHSNEKIVTERVTRIMNVLLWIWIPSALLIIFVGTVSVRRTSSSYEKHLEKTVIERTAELQRNYEELKKTKEKLAQSEKMAFLGQLMAGIAHEINNPLTSVIGNADYLLIKKNLDEKQTRFVQRIKNAGDRCVRLVKNLLSFSRKESFERNMVPLKSIIDTVLYLLETELQQYKTKISLDIPDDLPRLVVDRLQIEQVFFNLIKNAMQEMYDSERNSIIISAELEETFVFISVKDTGPGISADRLPRLFDAFFTSKAQGKGTGLGLTLCHRFTRAHGGDISVQSQVGEGTEFVVKLPVEGAAI